MMKEEFELEKACRAVRIIDKLSDTVPLMVSGDYKERFVAEYYQTKIRYDKLHAMLVKYEADKLDFKPKCSFTLLSEQASRMGALLRCLEVRAEIEGINLKSLPIKEGAVPQTVSFPVSVGDTVHYIERSSERVVSFVPYEVCGLALKDGKQYVITADGDLNEIYGENCILDIGVAARLYRSEMI